MKHFSQILWLFFLSSCLTVGKVERNCDKFAAICITDQQTTTKTIYRDTTIYVADTVLVALPPDTVTITDTVKIINNQAVLKPVTKQFGIIGVNAWINNSILNVRAYLTDSTILAPIRDTIVIPNALQTSKTIQTVVVMKKYVPTIYKITFWLVIIAVVVVLGWLAMKLISGNFVSVISKLIRL